MPSQWTDNDNDQWTSSDVNQWWLGEMIVVLARFVSKKIPYYFNSTKNSFYYTAKKGD